MGQLCDCLKQMIRRRTSMIKWLFPWLGKNETTNPGDNSYDYADDGSIEDDTTGLPEGISKGLKYRLVNDTYTVVSVGSCTDDYIVIPAYYHNKLVTGIGAAAFKGCANLVEISIPKTITTIGDSAFWGCSSLAFVTTPKSLTDIGANAFRDCTELVGITIPEGVTNIGDSAFSECKKLVEIFNLSSLNITAGSDDNGFIARHTKDVYNDANTESKLVNQDKYIFYCNEDNNEYYLMGYIGNESELSLPNDINGHSYEIYENAFLNRDSIISVAISNGVTNINDYAFSNCENLSMVTIGENVNSIGMCAFYQCFDLSKVVFADNSQCKEIGNSAFANCTNLVHVALPDGIREIEAYAFSTCESLESIIIPDSIEKIHWYTESGGVFENCSSLTTVYYGGNKAEWNEICVDFNGKAHLTDVNKIYNYTPEE